MKMKALVSWIALASASLTTAIAETLTVEGDLEVKAVPGEANGDLNIDGMLTVNGGNPVISSDATLGTTKWGTLTFADAPGATAWGNGAEASAHYATAWGDSAYAYAKYSTSFGIRTAANAYGSVVFGRYNLLESENSTWDSWVDLDPLLEVGIGNPNVIGFENGLNGFTILKNGKMALGAHTTLTGLQTRPETVQIEGPILVGDYQDVASVTATPGAIRYDATTEDFQGYKNTNDGWVSFTSSGTGATVPTLAEVIGLNSTEEAISSSDIRLTAGEQGASQASFILDRDGAATLSYNDYLTGSSNFKVEEDRALLEFRDPFGSIDSVIVFGKDSSEFPSAIRYSASYSAYSDASDRTLAEKGYVDAAIAGFTGGSSGPATLLVSADNTSETAISVTGADSSSLATTITGKVTLATAQGDISMGNFTVSAP